MIMLSATVRSKSGNDLVIDFFATPELMTALSSITDYQLLLKIGGVSTDFLTTSVEFSSGMVGQYTYSEPDNQISLGALGIEGLVFLTLIRPSSPFTVQKYFGFKYNIF